MSIGYDSADAHDIERYAQELLGKSLRGVLGDIKINYKGKGKLGQILEDEYFHYKPNSNPEPDFPEAGVELKSTPIKSRTKGLVSKERLVFNMIDYNEEYKKTFATSGFWSKNALLLLMFYIHEADQKSIDHIFNIIRLWRFPKSDLKIIKDDWKTIVDKIKEGKAHEISEGDTLYLGACVKGATAEKSMRSQPFSKERARGRAFSLKSKYINSIIQESLSGSYGLQELDQEYQSILSDEDIAGSKSFEQIIIERFEAHYGKTEDELKGEFELEYSKAPKNQFYLLAKAIMGATGNRIEEFEKADVVMKTIRLGMGGRLKESMSFAQIKYKDIVEEEWESSYLHETLTKRFFFVVFKQTKDEHLVLKRVKFWTMPTRDLSLAEAYWNDIRMKVEMGDYQRFLKSSEHPICHVRPKAINALDLMVTPQGTLEKKMAYWLNRKYVLSIIG
jgi:DNA mismatch repair protein MutH